MQHLFRIPVPVIALSRLSSDVSIISMFVTWDQICLWKIPAFIQVSNHYFLVEIWSVYSILDLLAFPAFIRENALHPSTLVLPP